MTRPWYGSSIIRSTVIPCAAITALLQMNARAATAGKTAAAIGFERIRRITGYLVGTLDRFNDAKRAEERDRVKHGMGGFEEA